MKEEAVIPPANVDQKKGCKIQVPLFFDMVGDNVVSRSLSILLVFLLFAFTALVILGGTIPVTFVC